MCLMTKAPDIPSVPLPGGVAMPMIGFGTWQLRGSAGYDAIRQALEAGYRHIDTATMYGNEAEVGQALRDSGLDRRQVFLTTKLPPGRAGRERAHAVCQPARPGHRLRRPVAGALAAARPRAINQVWHEFLALREEGKTRAVGVEQLLASSRSTP